MEQIEVLIQNNFFLLIVVAGAFFLLATSGKFVNKMMNLIYNKSIQEISSVSDEHQTNGLTTNTAEDERIILDRISTGLIIGKCENIIILLLTLTNSYTAIALIFTAKTIIRKEDIGKNSMFFLAGTLLNVTYSLIVSFLIVIFIKYTTI